MNDQEILWFPIIYFFSQVDELKELLSTKKDELEKLQERENTLTTTLNNTIGDGNKFEAFLIKVYKKKIKRVKKKTTNEGWSSVAFRFKV